MKRKAFGRGIIGAIAGMFVRLKAVPEPTEKERDAAIAAGTLTFNDNVGYAGKAVYSHTDKKGCQHFKIDWKAA